MASFWSVKRKKLYRRLNGTCEYCGLRYDLMFMTLDHCIRRADGGHGLISNLKLACWLCNQLRENGRDREVLVRIFSQWLQERTPQPPSWKSFMGRKTKE